MEAVRQSNVIVWHPSLGFKLILKGTCIITAFTFDLFVFVLSFAFLIVFIIFNVLHLDLTHGIYHPFVQVYFKWLFFIFYVFTTTSLSHTIGHMPKYNTIFNSNHACFSRFLKFYIFYRIIAYSLHDLMKDISQTNFS